MINLDSIKMSQRNALRSERELDLVEMVLYGNVERRGRHFRVRTAGEQEKLEDEGDY